MRQPERFRRYLAVSPSLWWDGGFLLERADELTRNVPAPSGHVYMCVGEHENRARFGAQVANIPDAMKALLPAEMKRLDMAGDMFMMEQFLHRWKSDVFSVEAHVFPEESHESIMGSALSRGLRRLYARRG